MILYYYNKNKKDLPLRVEHVEADIDDPKSQLKEYLQKIEGEETAKIVIFDQYIDGSDTLVDYYLRYLNFSMFKIHVIDPKKVYIIPNALEVNFHLSSAEKNLMQRVKVFKNKGGSNVKVHATDDFKFSSIDDVY